MSTEERIIESVAEVSNLPGTSPASIASVLHALATITEPSYSVEIKMVSLDDKGGGLSRKPGRILLSWRKLFDIAPDSAIAAAGFAPSGPYVRALIGLYIWNKIWRGSEEPLHDSEASVIETLWREFGRKRRVDETEAFGVVNHSRVHHGLSELSREEFDHAITRLLTMQCIKMSDGEIWLRDWVRKAT